VMRDEVRVFLGVTAFFVVIGVVYWFASYETAGSVMLAASALMGLVAGGSIWLLSRRAAPRVEDRPDAAIADGAGPVGVFPVQSVWPFAVGLSAAVFASGFAFGVWLVIVGGAAFVLSIFGFIAEARRDTVPSERTSDGSAATADETR
jgi:cytochrome c oxidase subunit IV